MELARERAISLVAGMLSALVYLTMMAMVQTANAQPGAEIYPQRVGENEAKKLANAYVMGFKEVAPKFKIEAACSYHEHPDGNQPPMQCSVTYKAKTPRETEEFKQLMRGGSKVLLEKYGQRVWASAVFEGDLGRVPIESYWFDPFWGFQYQTFWP